MAKLVTVVDRLDGLVTRSAPISRIKPVLIALRDQVAAMDLKLRKATISAAKLKEVIAMLKSEKKELERKLADAELRCRAIGKALDEERRKAHAPRHRDPTGATSTYT